MDAKTEEKVQQLQMLEQNAQSFALQRQNTQLKLVEIESAMKELEHAEEAYKIVGNIMVLSEREELMKDLASRKETAEMRVKSIERQEEKVRKAAEDLREEVLGEIRDAPE